MWAAFRIFAALMKQLALAFLLAGSAAAAQQTADLRVILTHVHFAANKAALDAEGRRQLDEVAALFRAHASATADIGAHTDASGSASLNLRLSQQRAEAVRTYLAKQGVPAKRLKAKGYGETKPLNRCARGVRCSEAEVRQNRRVELLVHGLPADSAARAPWLALDSAPPPRRHSTDPPVPKLSATPGPAPSAVRAEPSLPPKPLPPTFTGYTIEVFCTDKPAPAQVPTTVEAPVFLRQVPGGLYCYYVGAFFTLPEAGEYLRAFLRTDYPAAQVVAFAQGEKQKAAN